MAIDSEVFCEAGAVKLRIGGEVQPPVMTVIHNSIFADALRDGALCVNASSIGMEWKLYWKIRTKMFFPAGFAVEAELAFDRLTADGGAAVFTMPGADREFRCGLGVSAGRKVVHFGEYRFQDRDRIADHSVPFEWEAGRRYRIGCRWRSPSSVVISADGVELAHIQTGGVCAAGHLFLSAWQGQAEFGALRIIDTAGNIVLAETWEDAALSHWEEPGSLTLLKSAARAGVRIFQLFVPCGHGYSVPDEQSIGVFIEDQARAILRQVPEAWIVLRLAVDLPSDRGAEQDRAFDLAGRDRTHKDFWSYSSAAWRADFKQLIRSVVRYLDRQAWGERVIGVLAMSGHGGEFVYSFDPDVFSGYTEEHRARFAEYTGDAAVELPSPERLAGNGEIYAEPTDLLRLRYMRLHNELVASLICELADVFHAEGRQKRLFGCYYGYTVTGTTFNKGHNALARVLAGKVDFLASPLNYDDRREGGVTMFQFPVSSAAEHGILTFVEDDTRTVFSAEFDTPQWRLPSTTLSEEVIKRNFAAGRMFGSGIWQFDFGKNWFGHPALSQITQRMVDDYRSYPDRRRNPMPEIVVLVDENSYDYLNFQDPAARRSMVFDVVREAVTRCGAPYRIGLLSDLEKFEDGRFFLFLNCVKLDGKQREAIRRIVRRPGCGALFCMNSGYFDESGCGCGKIGDLTGIPVGIRERGAGDVKYPIFDPQEASALRCAPGIAGVRLPEGGMSFFAAEPESIQAASLRQILRECGVPLWLDGDDEVFAGDGFFAVHTQTAGVKRFFIPPLAQTARMEMRDIFTGETAVVSRGFCEVELPEYKTGFWRFAQESCMASRRKADGL